MPLPPLAARALAVVAALSAGCASGSAPAPSPAPAPVPRPVVPAPSTAAPVRTSAAPADEIAPDVVAESLLVDVQSADSTIAIDVRYATPFNFVGEVLPGYEASRAMLRREAAAALGRVQASLRDQGLGLRVFDAYRPARATAAMVAWTRRVQREDLLRDGYIAERSRHNLGLAVDLTLVDLATGKERKMGTAFDTFSRDAHTANASGEVAVNRRRLVSAMVAEGFTNLPEEWWHFSYSVPDPLRFDLVIRPRRRD
jgi:D-alanyl-D-alanine dipeptidase